jgi:hypothetical protein
MPPVLADELRVKGSLHRHPPAPLRELDRAVVVDDLLPQAGLPEHKAGGSRCPYASVEEELRVNPPRPRARVMRSREPHLPQKTLPFRY